METALVLKPVTKITIGKTAGNEQHMKVLEDLRQVGPLYAVKEAASLAVLRCNGGGAELNRAAGHPPCGYIDSCPFCAIDSELPPPKGYPCPVEATMYEARFEGYCEMVDPKQTNLSIMSLLNEIVSLEIYIIRLQVALSKKSELVEDRVIGMDENNKPIEVRVVVPELKEFQDLLKLKLKIFQEMALTPKSRAQIGATLSKDPSTYAAELVSAYARIMAEKESALIAERTIREGRTSSPSSRAGDGGVVTELSPGRDGSWSVEGKAPVGTDDGSPGRSSAPESDAEVQDAEVHEPGYTDEPRYYRPPIAQ